MSPTPNGFEAAYGSVVNHNEEGHCVQQGSNADGVALIARATAAADPGENLRRARRSYAFFCFSDFLLTFLVYSIYLSMEKGSDQSYRNLFRREFVHYSFKTSFMDILILVFVRDSILLLVYMVFKRKHWIYAGSMSFFSTVYLAVKVFIYPMGDSSETVICYLLIISAFAMGWISTYLVDYHFGLTRAPKIGGIMHSNDNDVENPHSNRSTIVRRNPATARVLDWAEQAATQTERSPSEYKSVASTEPRFSSSGDEAFSEPQPKPAPRAEQNISAQATPENSRENTGQFSLKRASSRVSLSSLNIDKAQQEAKDSLHFLTDEDLMLDFDWKLEDSGAYGTSIFSTEISKDSKKLRLLKMEMVLTISPQNLDKLMIQFTPERLSWDDSVECFSLVQKIGQSDFIARFSMRSNNEQTKKKPENDDSFEILFTSCFGENGSIQRCGCPVKKGVDYSNSGQAQSDIISTNLALLGFLINPVASSKDKSELIFFLGLKKRGVFGSSGALKPNISFLLTLSESLLSKVRSSKKRSRNSEASYEGSVSCENMALDR